MKFTSIDLDESILFTWEQCINELVASENVERTSSTRLVPVYSKPKLQAGMKRYEWNLEDVAPALREPGEPLIDVPVWLCSYDEKTVQKEITLLGRGVGLISQMWTMCQRDFRRMGLAENYIDDDSIFKLPLVYSLARVSTMFEFENQKKFKKPFTVDDAYDAFSLVARLRTAASVCKGLQVAFDEQKRSNAPTNPVHVAMARQIARKIDELKPFEMLESGGEAKTLVELAHAQIEKQIDSFLNGLLDDYTLESRELNIKPYYSASDIPEMSGSPLDDLALAVQILRNRDESDAAFRERVANKIAPAFRDAARSTGMSMSDAVDVFKQLGASFGDAKKAAEKIDEQMRSVLLGTNVSTASSESLARAHAEMRAHAMELDQKAIAEEIRRRMYEATPVHLRGLAQREEEARLRARELYEVERNGGKLTIAAGRASGRGLARSELHETGSNQAPPRPYLGGETAEPAPGMMEKLKRYLKMGGD